MTNGFMIFGAILCLLGLAFAGPAGLIVTVVIIGGLWWLSISRASLAVRAYVYLAEVNGGNTAEEANLIAARIDTHAASSLAPSAMEYARMTGGQLAMISQARQRGFNA